MAAKPPLDPREMGFYVSLAQVGLEMVVPVVVGLLLDRYLAWHPWGVAVGAILGLATGLLHLVALASRHQDPNSSQRKRDSP
jgi:F0F1-type ATP synthase assembly protein I